jgi:hypothetical protein
MSVLELDKVMRLILFILPGFVAMESFRAQEIGRRPPEHVAVIWSLAWSLILYATLGLLLIKVEGRMGLSSHSLGSLSASWRFGMLLMVGGAVWGTALGRVSVLHRDLTATVRRWLFPRDTVPDPDPWFDVMSSGACLYAYVLTTHGPNYFGQIEVFSLDPEGNGRELKIVAPLPRSGEPKWQGPVFVNDDLQPVAGSWRTRKGNDAGGTVWVASSNVSTVIISQCIPEGERTASQHLRDYWPLAAAAVYVVACPFIWVGIS